MKKLITVSTLIVVLGFAFGFSGGNGDPDSKSFVRTTPTNIKTIGAPQTDFLTTLNESFEGATFPPAGWVKINVAAGSTGWERHLSGETPVPGFNGGTITVPSGGGTAVAFCNYLTGGTSTCDQWLVTPQIMNVQPGDSLTFFLNKFGNYVEHFDIKISTTTPTVAGMTTTIALLNFVATDSGWVSYKYAIGGLVAPGSNIYIGFREWVLDSFVDGASFCMDLVRVTGNPVAVHNNGSEIPKTYKLEQNYPNPFNPTTNIKFSLPASGNVKLAVYDILGNEVASIINGFQKAGSYTADFDASKLSSGIYFYKLISNDFTQTKKMMLIK